MFGEKTIIRIKDAEALEFCKVLGAYGVKFEISDVKKVTDSNMTAGYRNFTFRAPARKVRELYGEFSMMRDGQLNSHNNRESA